jgi:hypothetical protein
MPIRPFLAGIAFEPETIRVMSIAFEEVCQDEGRPCNTLGRGKDSAVCAVGD